MDTRASRCAMWKLHAPPSRYKEFNPAKERTAKLTPNRVTFLNGPNRDFPKRRRQSVRVYQKHKTFHDPLLKDRHLPEALDAISGCQDNQPSQDRRDAARKKPKNSRRVWNSDRRPCDLSNPLRRCR